MTDDSVELDQIPADDAPWHPTIVEFALSFDGYEAMGGFDSLASYGRRAFQHWQEDGSLPDDLLHLRACLYWEQRVQWHREDANGPSEPSPERLAYARALIRAMSALVGDR